MVPYFLQRLELDLTADARAIRRAYARELKKIDQEAEPEKFQVLREAYEAALGWAERPREVVLQGEAPAPAVNAAPSYALPKIVPRLRTEEVAQVVQLAQPERNEALENASEEFDRFMEAFQAVVSSSWSTLDATMWQENLQQCLASERLINVTVRDLFERRFAQLLADGWKRGNEVLFVIAAKVFEWETDRRHLRGLGGVGYVLEKALQERAMFESLDTGARMRLRTLVQRLRNPAEPTLDELKTHAATLKRLAQNFSTWTNVISDLRQLEQWGRLADSIPGSVHRAPEIDEAKLPKSQERSSSSISFRLILLVIFGLSGILHMCDTKPASSSPNYAQTRVMRKDLRLAPEPPAIGHTSFPPDVRDSVVPQAERPAPSPLSRKALSALTRKPPTQEVCDEIAKIAYDHGVGTPWHDIDPGAAFDRQVVACVAKKHWPTTPGSDPAVTLALTREKARLADFSKVMPFDRSQLKFAKSNNEPTPRIPLIPADTAPPVLHVAP